MEGTWQNTVLFYGNCTGPIHNNDEQLTHNQGGGDNYLPLERYKQICTNMRVEGNILQARC